MLGQLGAAGPFVIVGQADAEIGAGAAEMHHGKALVIEKSVCAARVPLCVRQGGSIMGPKC